MLRKAISAACLTLALTTPSASAAKLFPDSTLVVQDRFSDEIVGQGPDVMLIPGLASPREVWLKTAERLKGKFRLHLIQVAGFAGEPPRANASGPVLAPTAEAIDAYLVAQHLTPATVIGHSLGGTMLLYLAEHHPDHFKKVMLVDALPFAATVMAGPTATAASMAPMADQARKASSKMPMSDQMLAAMATAPADRAVIRAWSDASDTSATSNAFADDMTLDLRPSLSSVAVPVTLVYPDYAPLGSTKEASQARYAAEYAALKGIKLVQITNSVHFVMFDQPDQFAHALDAFLAE
jgi:pimeloyl-[acyl-carrier protein] methyl ester esterase